MAVSVTNIEGLVRAFAISTIQKKYPNLDITEHSSFDDLVLKPITALFMPVIEKVNYLEMMQNLENAEYMTDDELDRVGEGNYFITRKSGSKATAVLTLSFANVLEGEIVIVPAGIIFQTGEGKQFQTLQRATFPYEDMMPYFNPSTSNYDLPITVEATEIGSSYNVDINSITTCPVLFNTNLVNITNPVGVNNGTDKEINADYAKRIKAFYISRQLGTEPGYRSFILENFEEVEDVYVSGYKDQFMMRDIIPVWNTEIEDYVDKHMGGMVDLYIKGYEYGTEIANVTLQTNFFVLSQSYSSIISASVSALNDTDATKTPVILSKNQYTLNGQQRMAVVLNNTGEQSFSNSADSQIYIVYDYIDGLGATQNQIDSFIVGSSIAQLEIPVKEILSLEDAAGSAIENALTHYELIKNGVEGTTQELCSIKLINFDNLPNGSIIKVNYVVNSTLRSIGIVLDKEEYRLVTADVLVREAQASPVNIAIRIKMKSGYSLDNIKKSKIQASLSNFFTSQGLGSSIEESDIVTLLSTDEDIRNYIEYISLPFNSFYIPANASDPLTMTRLSTNLPIQKNSYPVLNKVNISEI